MRFRNSWMDATVTDIKKVADRIFQIKIQALDGTHPFTVGSHIDVSVMINGQPEIRSYSLVGKFEPDQPYTIAVKHLENSRGGSQYMCGLQKGNRIKISSPLNHFELSYNSNQYLLISGGIGITPVIGMAQELMDKGSDVFMIYIGRTASDMAYVEKLQNLLGDNLIVHFSKEKGKYQLENVRKIWEESDYNNANLRFETFGASGLFSPQKFTVKIPRFDKEIEIAENQSLLQALNANNINVMYDCQKGECGLCQIEVLDYSGSIDHRDCFFSEEEKGENKKMCACVSRVANGNLVIDTAYRGKSSFSKNEKK